MLKEAIAQRVRAARLRLGHLLVEVGGLLVGSESSPPDPGAKPGLPLHPTIGPAAQEMLDRGRRPTRRREVVVHAPLVGSAAWRRAEAAKKAGA